ncbi:MAG: lysylphosphatidylglycerol synthase transmembrane domain-containing protein [Bacteroidia bacterium]
MKQKLLSIVKVLLFLSLGIFLIWISVSKLSSKDISDITNALHNVRYGWIILSVFIGLISHVIRAIRWKMLLEPLGHHPKLSNTFFAVMVGYLANYAMTRIGEATRCGILSRYENIPFAESFGTVIVERIIDVLVFFLFIIAMFILQFKTIYGYMQTSIFPIISAETNHFSSGKILFFVFIGVVFFALIIGIFVFRKKFKGAFFDKVKNILKGFSGGLKSIRNIKKPFLFWFYSFFIWILYYLMLHVCFFSLDQTTNLTVPDILTVFIFGTFMVMLTPGGIGAYPFAMKQVLLLYGVNANIGYTLGWLTWLSQFGTILFFGLLSLILLAVLNKRKNGNNATIGT